MPQINRRILKRRISVFSSELIATHLVDSKFNLDGDTVNVSKEQRPNQTFCLFLFGRGVEAEGWRNWMRRQACKHWETPFCIAVEEACLFNC